MTIETYKAEFHSLKAAYVTGRMSMGDFIKRKYELDARYVAGKGSWLIPVV